MDGLNAILKDGKKKPAKNASKYPEEEQAVVVKKKTKTGRQSLTDNQEQFCKLVVSGTKPMDAMLQVFPSRKTYQTFNQNRCLKELTENPKIIKRIEELFASIRDNEVLGDMYNFEMGVKLLTSEIEHAKQFISEGKFSEALHRIILTSVQELNKMYGFNYMDKGGNTNTAVNVTFVNVRKPGEE